MGWLMIIILLYILTGALLVERSMRGAEIQATFIEWAVLLLLWPMCLKFFIHLAFIQSRLEAVEIWAQEESKNEQS